MVQHRFESSGRQPDILAARVMFDSNDRARGNHWDHHATFICCPRTICAWSACRLNACGSFPIRRKVARQWGHLQTPSRSFRVPGCFTKQFVPHRGPRIGMSWYSSPTTRDAFSNWTEILDRTTVLHRSQGATTIDTPPQRARRIRHPASLD
jgi:hypothetical protein